MQRNAILLDTVGQADFSDGDPLDYMEIQAYPVTCSQSHLSIVTLPTECLNFLVRNWEVSRLNCHCNSTMCPINLCCLLAVSAS